jgi:hypothetical protein
MTTPTLEFRQAASESIITAVMHRLAERNIATLMVATGEDAKAAVLELIPAGATVHSGKSKTLEDAGIFKALMESDRYDFLRRRTYKMDPRTQRDEIRRLGAAPDVMLGSVQALTQAGQLVVASASGSQIGPYASGAGKLILVIGSQKIVPDLEIAFRRIRDHVFPYEDARLREQMGVGTRVARILIIEQEFAPGRTTVVLVRQPIGV